jgi:UDP-N-acetylglucosamine transferase subunit ALG13
MDEGKGSQYPTSQLPKRAGDILIAHAGRGATLNSDKQEARSILNGQFSGVESQLTRQGSEFVRLQPSQVVSHQ